MILIIQNGYKCDYEMNLFSSLFFDKDDEVVITQNCKYENKRQYLKNGRLLLV